MNRISILSDIVSIEAGSKLLSRSLVETYKVEVHVFSEVPPFVAIATFYFSMN